MTRVAAQIGAVLSEALEPIMNGFKLGGRGTTGRWPHCQKTAVANLLERAQILFPVE
jgi:hypothetical protein